MKKNYFFAFCLLIIFSCDNTKTRTKHPKKEKAIFLNHEILNDSIHFKIKEYNKRNHTYRNICVFNKEKLLTEKLIYKVQKKDIHDEGYNTSVKKMYRFLNRNEIEIMDYTYHFFDYNIDNIDTVRTQIEVTPIGEIKKLLNSKKLIYN